MKLLQISDGGRFLDAKGEYALIDLITKEDLLRLVDLTLSTDVEFDAYDEQLIKNRAQQIVYKSVVEKLVELHGKKGRFLDESERLYLTEYEKYTAELGGATVE
jgi:hypothetical protein